MSSRVRKRAALEAFKAKRRGEQVYDKASANARLSVLAIALTVFF